MEFSKVDITSNGINLVTIFRLRYYEKILFAGDTFSINK